MIKGLSLTLAACAVLVPALAQQEQTFRASIRGGGNGDRGKCTIEVDVDDVAEVYINGDFGRLRTLSGQPAVWRRFECNAPLPANVGDFRFSGVDGRGRQTLVRDPRQNRGVAVIRIEDPKSGREGYTFDIEWSGGYGGGYGGPGGNYGGGQYGGGQYGGNFGGRGDVVSFCQDAVRAKADREYGVRDLGFLDVGAENAGRRDYVEGVFENRRSRERYRYSCSVDFNTGRLRGVDIVRAEGGYGNGNGYQGDVVRMCQDAVADRLQRDGYRDVGFRSSNVDNRYGTVNGSAVARDRYGNSTFDFNCSVDNGGRIRNLDVNRR